MKISVRTENLTKKYGKDVIVDSVNLNIVAGEIYGLIGENGAGKTTIMKMITGLIKPSSGKIVFYNTENQTVEKIKIGCIIEEPALYKNMTAFNNMMLQAEILGIKENKREKISELLQLVGLRNIEKKKVQNFSLGMKQRLGIALALLGDPELLILDEPINGLDPIGIREIRDLILNIKKDRNIAIVISSHILAELNLVADRFGIMHEGRLVEEMSAGELNMKIGENSSMEDVFLAYIK